MRDLKDSIGMQQDDVVLVLTSAPDLELAHNIAQLVVQEGLAACVNIAPAVLSIYKWKEQIESAGEIPLTIKTTWVRYAALCTRIKALHPYDVPEIIVMPVMAGDNAYIQWVKDMTMDRTA